MGDAPFPVLALSYYRYVCRGGGFSSSRPTRQGVQNMVRSALSKVAWVGRTASMVFGLALVMALVVGVATTAIGATGGNFILGKANGATSVSKLTASVAGPALTLVNNSTAAAATALNISVASGKPPLKVNGAAGTATNLSADKLDGRNSSEFVQTSEAMSAVVDSNGNLLRGEGATLATKDGTGSYFVVFNREVESCAWVATLNGSSGEISVDRLGPNTALLEVETRDSSGTVQDRPFSLAVHC